MILPIAVLAAIAVFASLGTHFKSNDAAADNTTLVLTKSVTLNAAPGVTVGGVSVASGAGQVGGNYITLNVINPSGTGNTTSAITVTDVLPAGTTAPNTAGTINGVLGLLPGDTVAIAGQTVTWTINSVIAAGSARSIAIPITLTGTPSASAFHDNSFTATGTGVPAGLTSNVVRFGDQLNAEIKHFDVDAASEALAGGVALPRTYVSGLQCNQGTTFGTVVLAIPPITPSAPGDPCFATYAHSGTGGVATTPLITDVDGNPQGRGLLGYLGEQDDFDDTTGSLHMVCLMAMLPMDLNLALPGNPVITWNILPTAGSAATINPPGGIKVFRYDVPGYNFLDPVTGIQWGLNCVTWRSSGTGAQNITATVNSAWAPVLPNIAPAGPLGGMQGLPTGPFVTVYHDSFTTAPAVKEWNTIDSTKIVAIPPTEGAVGTTNMEANTGSFAWWRVPGPTLLSGFTLPTNAFCVRDPKSLVPINFSTCLNYANVDYAVTNTVIQVATGIDPNTTVLRGTSRGFIDYTLGSHQQYNGTVDGQRHIFTLNPTTGPNGGLGTCGSVRIENPRTGGIVSLNATQVGQLPIAANNAPVPPTPQSPIGWLPQGPGLNVTNEQPDIATPIIGSDMGVGFQVTNSTSGTSTSVGDCAPNEYTVIRIETREDVQLRSDLDVAPDEYVVIQWILPVSYKRVFLAWAGQRVLLEQDWRYQGGDVQSLAGTLNAAPGSTCLGTTRANTQLNPPRFPVIYLRGTGPGNFLPELGAVVNGIDQATVQVATNTQQTTAPNDSCISRVLYESEDPGEVDIEAFIDQAAASKVAFVIYYMKIEDVKVSLVKDVSKPTHNGPSNATIFAGGSGFQNDFPGFASGSNLLTGAILITSDPGTNGDYSFVDDKGNFTGGNPWDASKDVTEVDWNVSKDLLVRARVRGWFVNSNPSGRARDDSTPGNVRPIDRWIMPDDWVVLAGGSGVAEQFSPQYDLMIAPNNAAGRALMDPTGRVGYTAITTVAAAFSAADQTATLTSAALIPVGSCLLIDAEWITVTQKAGNVITLGRFPLPAGPGNVRSSGIGCGGVSTSPAAHAAGARVAIFQLFNPLTPNTYGVPFEGPYSTVDIPGLAALFQGGAAISALAPGNIRDTIWADGVVNSWDAPMPEALLTFDIRGAGFIRQVWKYDVYYLGTPNTAAQIYPNPYYVTDIPGAMWIAANNVTAGSVGSNGSGYLWSTWANAAAFNSAGTTINSPLLATGWYGQTGQGPYTYWQAIPQLTVNVPNTNENLRADTTVTAAERRELAQIRVAYGSSFTTLGAAASATDTSLTLTSASAVTPGSILQIDDEFVTVTGKNGNVVLVTRNTAPWGIASDVSAVAHAKGAGVAIFQAGAASTIEASTIGRTLVVYTDNHGEAMVTANGDFKLDYAGCATNAIGGGKHCAQGDKVGTSTINAVAQYPDFAGKHPPVKSNDAKVTWTWGGYKEVTIEDGETDQFKYVVFHGLDRDGWCDVPLTSVSLHPVLTSIDSLLTVGANDPDETVDFLIDGGAGKITDWAGLARDGASGERGEVSGVETFSTALNDPAAGGFREFPTLHSSKDECQAWVKVSSSLLDIVDVLVVAHDDEGDIGFDRVVDFTNTTTYQLSFRWSLITWAGADGISPSDALKGTGPNAGGTDIFSKVTAVYGWNQSGQTWSAFFPSGVGVPGANDLTALKTGQAYWIAITGPDSVTWTIVSNVN